MPNPFSPECDVTHRRTDDNAFTLIELLIVMVILGVLATIVLFATGTFATQSKTSACGANAKIMNTAEDAYAAQHEGALAAGDVTKLQPYIMDTVPTSGVGAVKYDTGSHHWACA